MLQEIVYNLQNMAKAIGDFLFKVNTEPGDLFTLLKRRIELMASWLYQYEVAFPAEHFKNERRLN